MLSHTTKHHINSNKKSAELNNMNGSCLLILLTLLALIPTEPFVTTIIHPRTTASSFASSSPGIFQRKRKLTKRDANSNDDDIINNSNMPSIYLPDSSFRVDRMSSTDLAYVGDVVYELMVRTACVWPPRRTADLQTLVVGKVRAEYQADLLQQLKSGAAATTPLTENDLKVLTRGRNSVSGRRNSNGRDPVQYQDATAFEAWVGYLYLTEPARCTELLSWIREQLMEGGNDEDD